MNNRAKLWLLGSIPLLSIGGLVAAALWKLPQLIPDVHLQNHLLTWITGAGFLLALVFAAVWGCLDRACFVPLRRLARAARTVTESHAGYAWAMPPFHLLGELPARMQELGEALHASRREAVAADTAGMREVEDQKSRWQAVLQELSEGVLICDAENRIRFYNSAALKLLPNPDAFVPGCSLYDLWSQAPIEETLELLRSREQYSHNGKSSLENAEFACATVDQEVLLHCRMRLLPSSLKVQPGFFIIFRDPADQGRQIAPQQFPIDVKIGDLQSSLANLRAAAENLTQFSDVEIRQRQIFQRVRDESTGLSRKLEALADDLRLLLARQWPLHEIYSADLLGGIVRRFGQHLEPRVLLIGAPVWLHVDSQSILLLVKHLIEQLHACGAGREFEIECLPANRRVYLDIIWQGRPLSIHRIQEWSEQRLQDLAGAVSVTEVLRRHNSELWSQAHRNPGKAMLRIPLPTARRQWQGASEILTERHEVYDLALPRNRMELEGLTDKPLSKLSYVVFDIETTGLDPFKGDEIIQIAAVRVADRRVLAGEIFDCLVNPGKSIPKSSIRFHGITDDQVRDKRPIEKVLAEFKTFVADDETVLVTHHAALRMKFLNFKAKQAGIRFANPVLDIMLLSAYLHDYMDTHHLNAIADRLGVSIKDRHIGPGDALVIAHTFVRLLSLLEAQDIKTLEQALEACEKMVGIRKRQAQI